MLGVYYLYGTGVPINDVEAYKWFNLSVAHDKSDNAREATATHPKADLGFSIALPAHAARTP